MCDNTFTFYRVQINVGEDFQIEWYRTKAEGLQTIKSCKKRDWDAQLDQCLIPKDKEGFLTALNHASLNRASWPWEFTKIASSRER